MGPIPGLLEKELRPPPYDLHLVGHIGGEHLEQVERPRHAVDQGHHVRPEAGLQGGVLVQVVQHDVGVGVALEIDLDAGQAFGRGVVGVPDALELAGVDQLLQSGQD